MYAKIVDGALQIAPRKLAGDGVMVYNPPTEMYLAAEYKPLHYTDLPEAPEGYHYEGGRKTKQVSVTTGTILYNGYYYGDYTAESFDNAKIRSAVIVGSTDNRPWFVQFYGNGTNRNVRVFSPVASTTFAVNLTY